MSAGKVIYAKKALDQVPRLLSMLDRNEYSPTFGCFERYYWQDKVLDTPSAHSQEAVLVLALIYKYDLPDSPYYSNDKIRGWCIAGMRFWAQIQHNDGSFDEFYPNERAFGATAITLYAVLESYGLLKEEMSSKDSNLILDAIYKAAMWLTKNDEPYLLTNHQAQASVALLKAGALLDEDVFSKAVHGRMEKVIEAQSQEGWFPEYGGADLGYLTTTISFLAKYYKETEDKRLLEILNKAISFSSYFIYPNNAFGGIIGSRNTAHFWPHGFEIMASEIPLAGSVADAALEGIKDGAMISSGMEDRYFCEQQYDFLQAYLDYIPRKYGTVKMPFDKEPFSRYFDDAKIFITKKKDY